MDKASLRTLATVSSLATIPLFLAASWAVYGLAQGSFQIDINIDINNQLLYTILVQVLTPLAIISFFATAVFFVSDNIANTANPETIKSAISYLVTFLNVVTILSLIHI